MAMRADEIMQLICAALPGAKVLIEDTVGDGDHYVVKVTAQEFVGKTRLQQHQMVYRALGDRVGTQLHALSVQTYGENK